MSKTKYRIVTEKYGTYAIELKVWWWPRWIHWHGGFRSSFDADRGLQRVLKLKEFKPEVVKEYD